MPELPEVETVANGVHARVRGRRITQVWTSGKPQTFKSPESEIAAALAGAKIDSVRRVGKTIVMTVSHDAKLEFRERNANTTEFLIHLGMTGRLLVCTPDMPLAPHTHAVLTLDDAREVRFVDPRRFGRLSIHHTEPSESGAPRPDSATSDATPRARTKPTTHNAQRTTGSYTGPGREPLTISLDDFAALFGNRKIPVKAALLNQSLLHGVGNIYADEALFRAGIRPTRQAARLSRAELARLRTALIAVLKQAIKLGGSSVSDYVDADGVRGFFQLRHKVYQRTGEPCRTCGSPIQRVTLAGRGTHFCSKCQK